MSKEAAATRALAKYFQSVGEGLAGIGEPGAAEWLRKAGTLKQRLKPQVITSDARKICRAFDAADERDSTEIGV